MTPLAIWTCDTCGDQITDPNMSLVVWNELSDKFVDYKIVHKNVDYKKCDPGDRVDYENSLELSNFLGADGAAMMLSWLSSGPILGKGGFPEVQDFDRFVDLFRRVQTPYYEEARRYFGDEDVRQGLEDVDQFYPYQTRVLERIAKQEPGPY